MALGEGTSKYSFHINHSTNVPHSFNPGSLLAASRPAKPARYLLRYSKGQEFFVLKKFSPFIRMLSHTIGYTVPPHEQIGLPLKYLRITQGCWVRFGYSIETLYWLGNSYQRFVEFCCLILQGTSRSSTWRWRQKYLWNVGRRLLIHLTPYSIWI